MPKKNHKPFINHGFLLRRPDEQMLQSLYTVLETHVNNPEPIFILSPTAVVHTFCRNHRDCGENDFVKTYIDLLEANVLEKLENDLSVRANRENVGIFFFLFN